MKPVGALQVPPQPEKTSYGCCGVSSHYHFACLFKILFRLTTEKTYAFCITGLFLGESLEFLSQKWPALRCVLPRMTSSRNRGSEWKSPTLYGPFSLRKFGVNIHVDAPAFQIWLLTGTISRIFDNIVYIQILITGIMQNLRSVTR